MREGKFVVRADKQGGLPNGQTRPQRIGVRPIGLVVSREGSQHQEIKIASEFVSGLDGVESHDHLWVLFWMHQLTEDDRAILQVHPRGDTTQPKAGVFALHSPCRPNPIGMTRVRLLGWEGSKLVVEGLDAFDGSPVLDIKSG
ncbi:MAG: tRNA (N6-threonylcarbamoyladenosine(37)-N6)-methyltransferase TrmO [Armatimonadota bacterium]|nr:MAG: tRNA (N6-threonylcarbamoyladenosine(37)-N6)-methyltransferase TrmO [Armatimonadota bacterium]